MAIRNLTDLAAALAPGRRLLGLDPGTKTIGLAISDPGLLVASPLETLKRTRFAADAAALAGIVRDHQVGGLVIGLPLNLDGSEGPAARNARLFARELIRRAELFDQEPEIAFWDERLTTAAVERLMIAADLSRRRRARTIDRAAAAYILQGALDALGARPTLPNR